jgi:hypothetical protein
MDIITTDDLKKYTYSGISDAKTLNPSELNLSQEFDVLYTINTYCQKHGITEKYYAFRIEEMLRKIITIISYEEIDKWIYENRDKYL